MEAGRRLKRVDVINFVNRSAGERDRGNERSPREKEAILTLKPILSKLAVGAAVTGLAVTASATAASAHQHQIVTPSGNVVTLPCEPFHGETPGQSHHSANWDEDRGLHPIHWGLHKGPSEYHRNIVVEVSDGVCP